MGRSCRWAALLAALAFVACESRTAGTSGDGGALGDGPLPDSAAPPDLTPVGGDGGLDVVAPADADGAVAGPSCSLLRVPLGDTPIEDVDLLFAIDNSSSMADNQSILARSFGLLVDQLANPPVDPMTMRPRHPAVRSIHLGVISTDLGTPGSVVPSCANTDQGDDGLLNPIRSGAAMRQHQPWTTAPPGRRPMRCENHPNQFPSFLRFDRLTSDAAQFHEEFICNAYLSVGGCGLEQQLESMHRALVLHNPRQMAGNTDPNAGFVRDDAVLALVAVTDEEDGSTRDCRYAERGVPCTDAVSVFDITSTQWASNDLNLRFYLYTPGSAQDPTWPLDRYIDPRDPRRGFLGLKPGRPELVTFSAIAGVPINLPTRTAGGRTEVDYDALLGRMPDGSDGYIGTSAEGPISMRQRSLDPMCPTRVVPACRREGSTLAATCDPAAQYFAWPSRRVAQVARRFHESYQNGALSSICRSDYAGAVQQIVERIQPRLRSRCLPHTPVAAPAPCEPGDTRGECSRIPCVVREILPAGASSSAACTADRGRTPGDRDPTLLRDTCVVQQVALPRGAAPPGDREGFYYDTRPDPAAPECRERIGFTAGARLAPGASAVLECVVSPGSPTLTPTPCDASVAPPDALDTDAPDATLPVDAAGDAPDGDAATSQTFVYAISEVVFDQPAGGPAPDPRSHALGVTGFNLDARFDRLPTRGGCDHIDFFSALDPDQNMGTCVGGSPMGGSGCSGGIDNQLPAFVEVFSGLGGDVSETIRDDVRSGRTAILLRVSDVNGAPGPTLDDPSVRLDVYPVAHPTFASCASIGTPGLEYAVDDASLAVAGDLRSARLSYPGRIVRGRLLVDPPSDPARAVFPLPFGLLSQRRVAPLQASQVRLSMTPDRATGGNLGGYVPVSTLVTSVSALLPPGIPEATLNTVLQSLVDVALPVGPSAACAAPSGGVSMGLGFQAVRATLAAGTVSGPLPARCGACPAGWMFCGGLCVDVLFDRDHCGACGRRCSPGQTCSGGVCGSGSACSFPRALCAGVCVDLSADTSHCGMCGARCAVGQSCSAGACRTPSPCLPPRAMCGASCVDVATDAANCGVCGLRCAAGEMCAGGACSSSAGCSPPRTLCSGLCTDTSSDLRHCGRCGNACASGEPCVAGTCACPAPRRRCGALCVDVGTDPSHCGACGVTCGTGLSCSGGRCVSSGSPAGRACTMPDPAGGTDPLCGDSLVCIPTSSTPICTAPCENDASQAVERMACGGVGSTCLTQGDGTSASSLCAASCSVAAMTVAAGACRAGFVCTGWWYTHAGGRPDVTGCYPFCSQDSDCGAGAVCNARTGACGATAADMTRLPDGSPCDPRMTVLVPGETRPRNIQCRGICFTTSSTRPTEGVCGSFINTRLATACPDDPAHLTPLTSSGADNLAICIFRDCSANADCRAPHICRYPEDATGVPATELPPTCGYPTPRQPTGIAGDGGATGDASADG